MLRIGVLKQEYGGRRPPVPSPRKNGEREKKEIGSKLHPTPALRVDPPPSGEGEGKNQCPNPKFSFPTRCLPPRCRSSRIAVSRSISSPISVRTRRSSPRSSAITMAWRSAPPPRPPRKSLKGPRG